MATFTTTPDSCASRAFSVTPADSDMAQSARAVYIGTGGDMKVTTVGGDVVTFTNLSAGSLMPVSVKRIWSTGTTASGIVGLI